MSEDGGRAAVGRLLLGLMDRPEWHRQAACRDMDPALSDRERRAARRRNRP